MVVTSEQDQKMDILIEKIQNMANKRVLEGLTGVRSLRASDLEHMQWMATDLSSSKYDSTDSASNSKGLEI